MCHLSQSLERPLCASHCSKYWGPAVQDTGRAPSLLESQSRMQNWVLAEDGAPFRVLPGVRLGARQG